MPTSPRRATPVRALLPTLLLLAVALSPSSSSRSSSLSFLPLFVSGASFVATSSSGRGCYRIGERRPTRARGVVGFPARKMTDSSDDATSGATKAFLDRHSAAFGAGDVDGIMADYTDESVYVDADGAVVGRDAIRPKFEEVFKKGGIFEPGTYEFEMEASHVEGEVALIVWNAQLKGKEFDVKKGTDTFVVRDGKVAAQTLVVHVE